jgi:hypothetical protein
MGRACGTHGRGEKSVQGLGRKTKGRRPLGRPRRRWEDGIKLILGRLAGGCGLDSTGSGEGPVASCQCGDETSGSCATDLISPTYNILLLTLPNVSQCQSYFVCFFLR